MPSRRTNICSRHSGQSYSRQDIARQFNVRTLTSDSCGDDCCCVAGVVAADCQGKSILPDLLERTFGTRPTVVPPYVALRQRVQTIACIQLNRERSRRDLTYRTMGADRL